MTKLKTRFPGLANELFKYAVSIAILGGSIGAMFSLILLKEPPKDNPSNDHLPTVTTALVDHFTGTLSIRVSGLVVPYREVNIAAEVSGKIKEKAIACQAGQFVAKDTPLLIIDDADYQFELKRLQTELLQAKILRDELQQEVEGLKRSLTFAKEEHDLHKKEYERRQQVGSALSTSELDTAKRNWNQAERSLTELEDSLTLRTTGLSRLQNGIELSKIKISKAELDIQRTIILAPFAGVVVDDMVEKGDYVATGTTVVSFEDTSKAEIKFSLRADQLDQLIRFDDSNPVDLQDLKAYQLPPLDLTIKENRPSSNWVWEGKLAGFDGNGLDQQTKTFPCRGIVDHPIVTHTMGSRALVRGMFLSVQIRLPIATDTVQKTPLLVLPALAVQPTGVVWQVDEGKLKDTESK